MKKNLALGLLLALLTFPTGCLPEQAADDSAQQEALAEARQKDAAAQENARLKAETVAAAQEKHFRPSPEEAAFLEAAVAKNLLESPNGYFTNQDGVSGYFQGYERPFNFTWDGRTVEIEAFDGHRYRVIDGPGKLTLKYAGDSLLLQRYEGDYKRGLWDGHGSYWSRNGEAGGHNYFFYQGNFRHDRMEGLGVADNYNLSGRGNNPLRYSGDLRNNNFHGQGQALDLASGRLIFKGLWFEGQPFEGSPDEWRTRGDFSELYSLEHQYQNLLMTGRVKIGGAVNPQPGQGPLTIIPPLYTASKVRVRDHLGRAYQLEEIKASGKPEEPPVSERDHPLEESKAADKPEEPSVSGVRADIAPGDYPLTLNISYDDVQGRRQFIQLTVKRPFVLQWEDEEDLPQPDGHGEDDPRLSTEDELREEIKAQMGLSGREPSPEADQRH